MKKLYITLAILFAALTTIAPNVIAHEKKAATTPVVEEATANIPEIEILATMNQKSKAPNRIWVGTFQLVWNELMDNIVYGPVRFMDETPKMAKELNKQAFKKSNLSEKSYYTKYGEVSPALKKEIEKAIKEKFNETSDILDSFDFSKQKGKLFIYAMLKKDFQFLQAFDKLSQAPFGNNTDLVNYFGINDESNKKLYKNVKVLFYNNSEDFAVKLVTKDKDEVILYRTNDDVTFNQYYADITTKTAQYKGSKKFAKKDELIVPEISLYQETSFPELENKEIKRTNFVIDKTIETIDFKMNNEGVKLKSEAAMMVRMTSLTPEDFGRHFYFMDNFVLFLTEKGQKTPYYAMKVNDVQTLNKTGRN